MLCKLFTGVGVVAALLSPLTASAQLLPAPNAQNPLLCSAGSTQSFMGYTQCAGAFLGNNKNLSVSEQTSFNSILAGWGVLNVDRGGSDDANAGPFQANFATTTGTLTFDGLLTGSFVLAVKAGNAFSLYYFLNSGPGVNTVQFSTFGTSLGGETANGLSHAQLYGGTFGSSTNVVPEPSTYALMATGMIGLVGFARLRRQA